MPIFAKEMAPKKNFMDKTVFDYVLEHHRLSSDQLHFIPSENSPSINARLAFLTDIFGRYYFPIERGHSVFPGNEIIEKIYERCCELLREVTGARFVVTKPISGLNAMTIVLSTLAKSGEAIATIAPANGGHGLTRVIARRLGVRVLHLPYDQESFQINIDALPDFTAREKIALIYLDQQHILFPYRLKELRANIPESVKIYYDGSHVMGLIWGDRFQDPLREGADFFGGSTHKTVPGPHKAFIATNDEEQFGRFKASSEIFVSHDHGAEVVALALVLEEMRERWPDYAARVVKNAQYLASSLAQKGFHLAAEKLGFTMSHQLWIDIEPHMDAFDAAVALARCNIIVNACQVPTIANRFALRLGVQEVTYLGANEPEMEAVADIFKEVFIKKDFSEEKIKGRVREIKKGLRLPLDRIWLEKVVSILQS